MFLAYNLLQIGEKMDFMNYHLIKMQELEMYRQNRRKANMLADFITLVLLLLCSFLIYLKIGG